MTEVLGHETVLTFLARQLRARSIHHAYLFVGPEGVGKCFVAHQFAQGLLCERGGELGQSCHLCPACHPFEHGGIHPDLAVLRREREDETISVESVRSFSERLSLHPLGRSRNVGVIEDAERLTIQAANALLKLLEEPRGETTIILTARDERSLPATVRSRCLAVRFSFVPRRMIEEALRSRGLKSSDVHLLASMSQGRPGIAMSLLQPEVLERSREMSTLATSMLRSGLLDRFHFGEEVIGHRSGAQGREAVRELLQVLRSALRERLLERLEFEPGEPRTPPSSSGRGPMVEVRTIREGLRHLHRALTSLEANVQPKLALEATLLTLPRV